MAFSTDILTRNNVCLCSLKSRSCWYIQRPRFFSAEIPRVQVFLVVQRPLPGSRDDLDEHPALYDLTRNTLYDDDSSP